MLPRGAWAAQASAGTLITFDSSAIAARFAANKWIQVGINPANLRKVSAVGGNSISVSGSAVTVASDDRIFIIGSTQPQVTGSSATYLNPDSTIYDRDDDSSNRQSNSMITSDSNGQISFYGPFGLYDCLVQDGNQTVQGYIADLSLGMAEGVSTIYSAVFGATVTVNAAFGITGFFTGDTVTVNKALGVTGWATFGVTATFNAAIGVTGWATFGQTVTMNANAGVTGTLAIGQTATLSGSIVGTTATFSQTIGTSKNIVFNRLIASQGTSLSPSGVTIAGWGTGATWSIQSGSNDTRGSVTVFSGVSSTTSPSLTINFTDGVFASTPFYVGVRADQHDYDWKVGVGATNRMVFNFGSSTNVPGDSISYTIQYVCLG